MRERKFYGNTPKEAISKAKRELGPDLLLMSTPRLVKRRGLMGLFGSARYEVSVASAEEADRTVSQWEHSLGRGRAYESGTNTKQSGLLKGQFVGPLMKAYSATMQKESDNGAGWEMVHRALKEVSSKVTSIEKRLVFDGVTFTNSALRECYEELLFREVDRDIARALVLKVQESLPASELSSPESIRASVNALVEERIQVSGGIQTGKGRARVVALIGPTGVGKTTTISKLVADFLWKSKRVGVVTIDTYRIAASDQLRKTLEVVGKSLKVANTPLQLANAIKSYADHDVVLVDTAGRSQRDSLKLFDLKEFFAVAPPDEVHLTISVTTHPANLFDVIERYSILPVDCLLLTKFDEACKLGMILAVLERAGKPVSYLTTGQGIPWDIEVATPARLRRLILGDM